MVSLIIDEVEVKAREGATVLEAAREAGIYIPAICSHPDLPSSQELRPAEVIYRKDQAIKSTSTKEYEGCRLCLVEIEGNPEPVTSCTTPVAEGMVVHTNTPAVQELRKRNLSRILGDHPHTCLTCAQREGCAREPCSMKIDYELRCCPLLGRCELQKTADFIGISVETPRYTFANLPVVEDEPLFKRNYNLCINCARCIRVCQEVRGVGALGFVWQDDKAVVGTLAPSLKESGCRFCGACVEVCPTGALTDFDTRLPGEAAVQCKEACPAHIDIPRYIRLIAEEKFTDALAVIREKVPFPMTLGHVCNHPCESACLRAEVNEPIAICALKRFAAEQGGEVNTAVAPPTNKRVAIVGSGPAGLTAAFYLAKQGHSVTIFEALPEPGGMLRVGIPDYRLPREALNREIEGISKTGIDIRLNTRVESLDSLSDEGYNAIFLGVGAHEEIKLGVEGDGLPGVIESAEFLRCVNLGEKVEIGERAGIIGGGNAAIDAARTSIRTGAKKATIFYRRTRTEMPASPEEIDAALEEGIEIIYLSAPTRIIQDNDTLKLECQRMELGEPDASGRRRPVPIDGSEFTTELDTVIAAIGNRPQVPEGFGVETGQGNTIKVSEDMMTTRNGVFSGGDAVSGAASVIEAIAAGRKAAIAIDQYLGGEGNIDEVLVEAIEPSPWIGKEEGFADKARVQMPCLKVEERLKDFSSVELGFSREMAIEEARRCLQCDLRLQLSSPPSPPEKRAMQEFTPDNINAVPEAEGVIQLYDGDKNVIYIAGTTNLRDTLQEFVDNDEVCYFFSEESNMYTSKQDELTQQYMHEHGAMPRLNDSMLDDLF